MVEFERCRNSAEYILAATKQRPKLAIILGSGLGALARELEGAERFEYTSIPGFMRSTNEMHEGALYIGRLRGVTVAALSGRYHYYEGYSMSDAAFPVGVLALMGIEKLIVTNAAGGINPAYSKGELVILRDHIKFFSDSPLRGNTDAPFGPKFFDMSDAYSKALREKAKICAERLGMKTHEGVYAWMPGPQYETPAEIRMLSLLGADVVGMSTVPEVIMAAQCGIETLGISCVTNMAAGLSAEKLSDEEVVETASRVHGEFSALVREIVAEIGGADVAV